MFWNTLWRKRIGSTLLETSVAKKKNHWAITIVSENERIVHVVICMFQKPALEQYICNFPWRHWRKMYCREALAWQNMWFDSNPAAIRFLCCLWYLSVRCLTHHKTFYSMTIKTRHFFWITKFKIVEIHHIVTYQDSSLWGCLNISCICSEETITSYVLCVLPCI